VNSDFNNIDIQLLKKYYEGRLTSPEQNALEQKALDDPFLKDAMEGFENSPGSFQKFYENYSLKRQKFGTGYFVIGGILTIALITCLIVLTPDKNHEQKNEFAKNIDTTTITKEVNIIPAEIDSLSEVPQTELINATEIVKHKTEIQKTIIYPESANEKPIFIEEDAKVEEGFKIENEGHDFSLAKYVPATYLFDMFVVDYRRIERDRTFIRYTRYEFTGTSAEFETEFNEQHADLVEKEIDVPYFDYLSTSMEYFAKDDYKKAITNYLVILEQYPEDANALFYGGLCYYNLNKFDKSLEFFDRLLKIDLNAFKEEAKWYKVKSLIKLNRISDAKNVLDEIIAEGGYYVKEAILLKKSL